VVRSAISRRPHGSFGRRFEDLGFFGDCPGVVVVQAVHGQVREVVVVIQIGGLECVGAPAEHEGDRPSGTKYPIAGVRLGPPATQHTREPIGFAIQVGDGQHGVRAEDSHPFSPDRPSRIGCVSVA
jgi:hypothetical protein